MKEFEEWWNKEVRPYIHNPKDKDVAKAGWKAALDWVLTQRIFDEECAKRYNDYTPGIISEKAINEELEE